VAGDNCNAAIAEMAEMTEQQFKDMPTYLPVTVIMQRRPSLLAEWSDYQWQAIGVAVTKNGTEESGQAQLVHEDGDTCHYLYSGFKVKLHIDECESYYHNLMSPTPRCYVVARHEESDTPTPFLVSLSFDEAHAYLEGDEQVYAVDIPAELYRWSETFVLSHYAPEKRLKRKRQNWKKQKQETLAS
jgi:hypothetical protein